MRKWTMIGAGLALAASMAQAFAAQPSEQQVHKLLDAVGVGRMLSQMNSQVSSMMRQSLPCVPVEYWQGFIDANASQQFVDRLVPVYQRHFTAEDIEGLVKFYNSPLGQKVINEMPVATAEGAQVGQQWANQRRAQLVEQLKQKGTLDANGQCPAGAGVAPKATGSSGH